MITPPLKPDERDVADYPVAHMETIYRPERSKVTGHVLLFTDWDGPEDAVYGGC